MKPIREMDTTSLESAVSPSKLFIYERELSQRLISLTSNDVSFTDICSWLERVSIHTYYFNRKFPVSTTQYQSEYFIDIKSMCYALCQRRYSHYQSYSLNYRMKRAPKMFKYHVISGHYLYVSLNYLKFMLKEHLSFKDKNEYARLVELIERIVTFLKNRAKQIENEITISPDSQSLAVRSKLTIIE